METFGRDDLTGKQFGYLKVLKIHKISKLRASWVCKCICGKEIIVSHTRLIGRHNRNPNKSCGCKSKTRNGDTIIYKRLYSTWYSISSRCYDERHASYERYGGKGITVCEEWRNSFDKFKKWALENGYEEHLTIDRIDSTKGYSPDNCRWEDYFTQGANKGISKNNSTGVTGVTYSKKRKYRSYIMRKGVEKYLGNFDTLKEAKQARLDAEKKYNETGKL